MALIKCPECNNDIRTNATVWPHCGNPLKAETKTKIVYENMTTRVSCWGLGGSNAIIEKLHPYLSNGWEIVSTVEDHWRSGIIRHDYTIILRRPKKVKVDSK